MPRVMQIEKFDNVDYVSTVCRETDDPIFVMNHGSEDMVLMNVDYYRKVMAKLEIYSKLDEAEKAIASGEEMDAIEHLNSLREKTRV